MSMAQREQDRGDERTETQQQWLAVEVFDRALKAMYAEHKQRVAAADPDDRMAVGLECSLEYLAFKNLAPARPMSNVVQMVPRDYEGDNRPYWGE